MKMIEGKYGKIVETGLGTEKIKS
ncbi:uncharacterized protein METZ01_LOCUS35239 [marine metagenome]|uniref:Uncharacterized protein n=1 Tax=marine metagenome TaxID=408172 RepID=A0A381QSQ1_9ZZZZ